MNLHHSKLTPKNGIHQHQQKKHMRDSRLPQPLLDFLTPTEGFFYRPSLFFKFKIIYFNPKSNLETIV
jgi:hypothetical protein